MVVASQRGSVSTTFSRRASISFYAHVCRYFQKSLKKQYFSLRLDFILANLTQRLTLLRILYNYTGFLRVFEQCIYHEEMQKSYRKYVRYVHRIFFLNIVYSYVRTTIHYFRQIVFLRTYEWSGSEGRNSGNIRRSGNWRDSASFKISKFR